MDGVLRAQLGTGDVDGDAEVGEGGVLAAPPVHLVTGHLQDHVAELDDEPGRLRQGHELAGEDDPARGVRPPDQGFHLLQPPGQVDHGLVVKAQLTALQCPAQLRLDLEAGHRTAAGLGVEDLDMTASLFLGPVHGGPGVPNEALGVGGGRARQGDADRGRRVDLPVHRALDQERGGQDRYQPTGQGHGLALVLQGLAQDHELVPAQPGDGVGRSQDSPDAQGELDQEVVSGLMAEAGIYVLETVDVDEDHGQ